MLRLLLLLAILAVVVVIVLKLVKGLRRGGPESPTSQSETPPRAVEDAKLVRCASCGAYVPRDEALPAPDGFRCGEPRCRESL